jgi:hypothetical protein
MLRLARPALSPLRSAARALPAARCAPSSRALHASVALANHARTGLYDFHRKHGAKMVPFAGYDMPLSYGDVGQSECQRCKQRAAPACEKPICPEAGRR